MNISVWNINAQPEQLWQVKVIYHTPHGAETGNSQNYTMLPGGPVVIGAQQKMTFMLQLAVPDNAATCNISAFF